MDTDLVIRAGSGDHGAFAEIVASVARRFHGVAYAILRDSTLAKDAAQAAMVWLNGTGDYDGWSYVVDFTGPMNSTTGNGLLVAAPLPLRVALGFPDVETE